MTRARFPIVTLIMLAAGCGGHGAAPSPPVTAPSAGPFESTGPFPTMLNARLPRSGSGAGGAAGPAKSMPLRALPPSRTHAKAEHLPLPLEPRLDTSYYAINPRSIRSEDATYRIDGNKGAGSRAPLTMGFAGGFSGSGAQDLSVATDGKDIFSTDGAFYIYTMSGSLLLEISHEQFYCFGPQPLPICASGGFAGDNRVIYDPEAQRWLTSATWLFNTGTVPTDVLGVSQTSDPTGAWYLYQFPACGDNVALGTSDQPHIGFNSKWIAVTSACQSGQAGLAVFDKHVLYAGGSLAPNGNWFEFDDPLELGNRDNPVLTYAPKESAEYLTASVLSGSNAAEVYSHIDGATDSPVFYAATDIVTTNFPSNGAPGPVDAPGCAACIVPDSNAWTHSSGVWEFSGQTYVVSTAVYDDPSYSRGTQVVSIAVSEKGMAKAVQISGGADGAGPLASEVAMPLMHGTPDRERAVIGYDMSSSQFYPGVMAAQWNISSNTIEFNQVVRQGAFTPTGYDAGRWVDYTSALVPIPGTPELLLGGQIAIADPEDPMRGISYTVVSVSAH